MFAHETARETVVLDTVNTHISEHVHFTLYYLI